MALGVVLFVLGLIFLLDSFDLIHGVGFRELWPLILVSLGAVLIYDRIRRAWRRR